MKIRSVKFNFIMNFVLTASSILFPLITFPYITRVLLVAGNGKIAFASSIITYFTMFASLGIPTYGIRACARVRDDKEKLSKTVQELLILNIITMAIVYVAFLILLFTVPKLEAEKELLMINSLSMVLNVAGVSWLYSALEQYAYISICSVIMKVMSLGLMFAFVKQPKDYIIYGAITVLASSASYIVNFIYMHRFVSLKKTGPYEFKVHLKPILVFFATTAAISVYTNLDVVMLRFMKSNTAVGYYDAAIKVKTILVSLITSLGTVLLPRLSYYVEKQDTRSFHRLIAKAADFVMVLAMAVMIYFIIFAKESILFLAGDAFAGAILPMMLLMPTVLFIGLSNVTGIQMLTPMGKEKKVLYSILWGALIDFVLNLWLIPKMGASGAAFATMIAELVVLIIQCYYLQDILHVLRRDINLRKISVALICGSGVAILVKHYLVGSPFLVLCVSAVGFFGVYAIMLLVQKETIALEVLQTGMHMIYRKR
ncbi:MAG: flippase [Lachnospiraceae bacterium]